MPLRRNTVPCHPPPPPPAASWTHHAPQPPPLVLSHVLGWQLRRNQHVSQIVCETSGEKDTGYHIPQGYDPPFKCIVPPPPNTTTLT